jgi:hypothetical protein
MRRPLGLILVLVSGFAIPLSAQGPVAGTWFTEFDAQVRIVNGSASTVKGHARIELQVSGDSIHGTWQNLNATGAADGPARPLGGTLTTSGAHFEALTPSEVVRRAMDNETHTQVIMSYDVAVHGDSLVGTVQWVALDHSSKGETRQFTATRKS